MHTILRKVGNCIYSKKSKPDTTLLDGPSTSTGLIPVAAACTLSATGVSVPGTELPTDPAKEAAPQTPNSTTSTVPLHSATAPNSPSPANKSPTMPAKNTSSSLNAIAITTTTTAEIFDENRFSILGKDIEEDFDIYSLPVAPKDDLNKRENLILHTMGETTASAAITATKKLHHRNNNNNQQQGDINSIESISDGNLKPLSTDFDWIDDLYLEHNGNEVLTKSKRKKKKKLAKEMDQLDGVSSKQNSSDPSTDEDEKVVKCLYYTLMCCDCTIS